MHHHLYHKKAVLNTLITRALRVSDKYHIYSKKENLHNVFLRNGYIPAQFNKSLTITKAHENKPKDSFKDKKVGDHKELGKPLFLD